MDTINKDAQRKLKKIQDEKSSIMTNQKVSIGSKDSQFAEVIFS